MQFGILRKLKTFVNPASHVNIMNAHSAYPEGNAEGRHLSQLITELQRQ